MSSLCTPARPHPLWPDGLFYLHCSPALAARLTRRYLGADDLAYLGRLWRDTGRSLAAAKSLPRSEPLRADLICKLRIKIKAIECALADLDRAGLIR